MKAEHRKELQTNVLASRLGQAYEGIKAGPSRNTLIFVGIAVLVVVLGATWYFLHQSSQRDNSALWREWSDAESPEQLDQFVLKSDVQGTPQGRLARFKLARFHLYQGIRELGLKRKEAAKDVRTATETYEKLIDESRDTPLLQQEALRGAAKGYETLGDLDKARTFYERLANEHGDSTLGKDAARQVKRLEADSKDLKELAKE